MAARSGMEVVVTRPAGYELGADVMALAEDAARRTGGSITETDDQAGALSGADVVYAKAWAGEHVYTDRAGEAAQRASLSDWRITADKMASTKSGVFMHCLPVRRGVVVDAEVLDGPSTLHLLQAEYRLHAQKAILEWIWDLLPPS
jgi:N-acetylornithine carbamoyltransferase